MQIKTNKTSIKPFIFVLMPFHSNFDDIYQVGIKAACLSAGAYCERVDEQIFVENILKQVYDQIAKADIIIAEMTGRNPNVFYETGYAHALNKQVILLTQNSDDIPFDLKHYPHIVYGGKIAHLKTELEKRIKWCIDNPREPITNANLEQEQQLNEIQKALSVLSENVTVIDTTEKAMDYLAQRFCEAHYTIKQGALAPSLPEKSYVNYDKALDEILTTKKNIKYLHVVNLDKTRWERVSKKISDPKIHNYYVKYYDLPDIKLPFLSYAVLDDKEIVMRYPYRPQQPEIWLSIKHREVVRLFVAYFQNLWEQANPLEKDDIALIQKFNEMYDQA